MAARTSGSEKPLSDEKLFRVHKEVKTIMDFRCGSFSISRSGRSSCFFGGGCGEAFGRSHSHVVLHPLVLRRMKKPCPCSLAKDILSRT